MASRGTPRALTFNGTTTGVAPLDLNGATTNQVSYTSGALPTGTISTTNVDSFSVPLLIPLDSSTINNPFSLTGNTLLSRRILRAEEVDCQFWRWNQCELSQQSAALAKSWKVAPAYSLSAIPQYLHRHHDG